MGEDAGKGAGEVERRRRNVPGRKEGRRKWERAKEAAPGWGEGMVELQPPQEKVVAAPPKLYSIISIPVSPPPASTGVLIRLSIGDSVMTITSYDFHPYKPTGFNFFF